MHLLVSIDRQWQSIATVGTRRVSEFASLVVAHVHGDQEEEG
jgi:hypothetical protein